MNSIEELRFEAYDALERIWFLQTVEEREHTDISLSLRLHIRPGLFIQLFCGQRTNSLFFALVEHGERVFGMDRERDQWHIHPFGSATEHQPVTEDVGPRPFFEFLAMVETLLVSRDLL
ncbi:MAG: hypothetical protein KF753_02180 [Caldilineaceae bacterium]|nr:hypothetical protein [Caldilineaceae bacterium]